MPRLPVLLLCLSAAGALAGDDPQPPQILGVWYGTYPVEQGGEQAATAEMWMLISWQLSKDGWNVSGHNRWNVARHAEGLHGEHTLGKEAEHFDQVKGTIARDGNSVVFSEVSRGNRIKADLTEPDTMKADLYGPDGGGKLFSVTLKRVDTHYKPTDAAVLGVDVSHHSGAVDWGKVKAQGYQFAYVKSSEGVDNPDAMFGDHWQGLKEAGMSRGAYHFYVTEDDPVRQAKFFASRIRDDPGSLPPAVDIELLGSHTVPSRMTDKLVKFLATLEQDLGVKPMIYTSSKFWDRYYEPAFSGYHLWMAEYGVHMPKVPFGWDNWLLWQHAANQAVDGVENDADINLLHPGIELDSVAGGTDTK